MVSVLFGFNIEPCDGLRAKYEFSGEFIGYDLFLTINANVSNDT